MLPRVIISPSPTICRVAPAIKVYAVLFRLEFSLPVTMDPIDEQKSRGRSFSPAIIGVLRSTIWNRCGRLMETMKKVNPENRVDLRHSVNEILTTKEMSYKRVPPITGFKAILTGNMHWMTVRPSCSIKYHCQPTKAMKQTGTRVRHAPTTALSQAST